MHDPYSSTGNMSLFCCVLGEKQLYYGTIHFLFVCFFCFVKLGGKVTEAETPDEGVLRSLKAGSPGNLSLYIDWLQ
jgi:hypothetical protein